ncbi:hypothetical protein J3E64_001703 [Sphingobium sp. OAS761]|uniref:hypothetical protein n=1 Tax=Sphingobium sp. OAS761 TaxID=2817901 RepID=UPI00209F982D|nr:hypothetical protein [Sphingobium sp. OAS761]MCP1470016.1 hypothetical protein [Sphingobium sp. OAS761]
MQDPYLYLTLAITALVGLAMLTAATLRAWDGWLDLKRAELGRRGEDSAPPSAAARIEVADLKERIRKLEAIAAGVDL